MRHPKLCLHATVGLLVLYSIVVFAVFLILYVDRDPDPAYYKLMSGSSVTSNCNRSVPCIAFGTKYFGSWLYWRQLSDNWKAGRDEAACGVRCDVDTNRSVAHAVLFHGRDLTWKVRFTRQAWQRWVYVNYESPWVTKRFGFDVSAYPTRFRYLFNWTATPLQTSTLYTPYGRWERREHPLTEHLHTYSPDKKKYMAFVVMSNCKGTFNHRLEKVAELQKYMPVHVYGGCGNRKLNRNLNEILKLSKQYRYYLSFESSFCRDYITEKFHRNGLLSQAVPVTFGGLSREDYAAAGPPHSFVHALDFASLRELAAYLTDLAADEPRYAEYFNWKRLYQASEEEPLLCAVCKRLHRDTSSSVADLSEYYDTERNCHPVDQPYLP